MTELARAIPVLRVFDQTKTREFYEGFLGFTVDWEHRFEGVAPVYMQVSRGDLVLHLSEHHGDASPGAKVIVPTIGIRDLHRELAATGYGYMRPGLEHGPGNGLSVTVIDPFGNRLQFREQLAEGAAP